MKQRQRQKMWELAKEVKRQKQIKLPENPVEFFEKVLHIKLFPYQAEFVLDPSPLKVLRWPRRAGKTTVMTGDALRFAMQNPRSTILCVMPKLQQTKEIFFQDLEAGFHGHLGRMDKNIYEQEIEQQLQTIIRFRNKSRILAEVDEPFTIRGHGPRMIIIDEMNFIRQDRDLWLSALLPMTLTRTVYITIASTPWNKDSIYHSMCFDRSFRIFSGNVWHDAAPETEKPGNARYFLIFSDVVRPNGPLDPYQVEVMKEQYAGDPWRWKREMESSFVDDETAFLPSSLIIKCQNKQLNFAAFEDNLSGEFYIGWDLGRERDPGVVAVIDKREDTRVLVHCNRFLLGTPYVTQMAYIKSLCDRWKTVQAVYYDHTGTLGMDEEIKRADFPGLTGIDFTLPTKHGLARFLKHTMMTVRKSDKNMSPEDARRQFELPYDMDVQAELNCVQWEQRPGSEIYSFSHPSGGHDDRFWAIALACVATTGAEPQPEIWVIPR